MERKKVWKVERKRKGMGKERKGRGRKKVWKVERKRKGMGKEKKRQEKVGKEEKRERVDKGEGIKLKCGDGETDWKGKRCERWK